MKVWQAEVKNFEGDGCTIVAALAPSSEAFLEKVNCGGVKDLSDIKEATDAEVILQATKAYENHGAAALKCPWCEGWRYLDPLYGTWRHCHCV